MLAANSANGLVGDAENNVPVLPLLHDSAINNCAARVVPGRSYLPSRTALNLCLDDKDRDKLEEILKFDEIVRPSKLFLILVTTLIGFFSAWYYVELIQGGLEDEDFFNCSVAPVSNNSLGDCSLPCRCPSVVTCSRWDSNWLLFLTGVGFSVNGIQSAKLQYKFARQVINDWNRVEGKCEIFTLVGEFAFLLFIAAVAASPVLAGDEPSPALKYSQFLSNIPINFFGIKQCISWMYMLILVYIVKRPKKTTSADLLRRACQKIAGSCEKHTDLLSLCEKYLRKEIKFEDLFREIITLADIIDERSPFWTKVDMCVKPLVDMCVKSLYLALALAVGVFLQDGWGLWSYQGMLNKNTGNALSMGVGLATFFAMAGIACEATAVFWKERKYVPLPKVLRKKCYVLSFLVLLVAAFFSGIGLKYVIDSTLGDPCSHAGMGLLNLMSPESLMFIHKIQSMPAIFSDYFQNLPFAIEVLGDALELEIVLFGSPCEKKIVKTMENLKVVAEFIRTKEARSSRKKKSRHDNYNLFAYAAEACAHTPFLQRSMSGAHPAG